jgi:hypothetical protein
MTITGRGGRAKETFQRILNKNKIEMESKKI